MLTRVFAPGFVFITQWCAARTSVERGGRLSRVLREEGRQVQREEGRKDECGERREDEWRKGRDAS